MTQWSQNFPVMNSLQEHFPVAGSHGLSPCHPLRLQAHSEEHHVHLSTFQILGFYKKITLPLHFRRRPLPSR